MSVASTPKQSKPVVALIALACLFTLVAVLLTFVRNQALDTDRYVRTVAPLAHERPIQIAIATAATDRLVAAIHPQQLIRESLPAKAAPLAGPISSAVTDFVKARILDLVSTNAFAKLWEVISRSSHEQLVAALTGKRPVLNRLAAQGKVTLDLRALVGPAAQVLQKAGLDATPPPSATAPEVVVLDLGAIKQAQAGVKALKGLTILFDLLALAFFTGAIALSKTRRRTVIAVGLSLAFTMAVIGLLLAVGESSSVAGFKTDIGREAGRAFYETLTRYLQLGIKLLALAGLIAALSAWWSLSGRQAFAGEGDRGSRPLAVAVTIAAGAVTLIALSHPAPLVFGLVLAATVVVPLLVAKRS